MKFGNQRNSRHLRWAGLLFFLDFFFVWFSFFLGVWVRFNEFSWDKLADYGPGVGVASLVLPSVLYIGGLYSSRHLPPDWLSQFRWIVLGIFALLATVLATGSLVFGSRVGRGVLLSSVLILVPLLLIRHWLVIHRRKQKSPALLCVVANEGDERAAAKLLGFWGSRAKAFGVVLANGYVPFSPLPVVGNIDETWDREVVRSFDSVLVQDRHLNDPEVARCLRGMRYNGAEIMALSDACEDVYHAVPVELITDSWLFRASTQSQLLYIRKLKRFSDILLSCLFLVLLSPFLLLGAFLVRLSSPGPLIFRQERAGRLGRPITVLKLRTMHVAEPGRGARWANDESDRIFAVGKLLRTFRVDEIPQLINVLRGEMSFVGPRPEQIAIVEELTRKVPFYRERLLIQPGLTGWAQVNYPYGASVEDSVRKLEYDLFYMKHMGIFLDFFILLETVKIVLLGGLRKGDGAYLEFRGEWSETSHHGPEAAMAEGGELGAFSAEEEA